MRTTLIAVLATALAATGYAGPLNKAHIPTGTKWVFHADFEAFKTSQLGKLVHAEIKERHQQKVDALKQLLGSDVTQDIYGLTLFGPDADEAHGVALIYAAYNRDKLLALLKLNPTYAESAYGDRTLYHWLDEKRNKDQVGAFAADNLIVISQTADCVQGVLDALAAKTATLAEDSNDTLWSLTEGTQGAFVVVAAKELATLAAGQEHAAVLQNSKMMAVIADEADGNLRLLLHLEADNAEAALQVEQIARGMLAFVSLQQKQKPELAPLIQACTLTRTDNRIDFEFRYPSADLFAMVKKHAPIK